ncbi:MAG: class I SAM-dependent methyltransferase [Planctomycetota bacterium]
MDHAEFEQMFQVEETNWWYRSRRLLVRRAVEAECRRLGRPLKILDVACATGMSFRFLSDLGEITGIDISAETIVLCNRRGITDIVQCDAMELPFVDGSFDMVLALDAFEHFEDDCKAMAEMHRVLKPQGRAIVTVPAFMFLWSPHDDSFHHIRRYTRGELGSKLKSAGLNPVRISYYSFFLMPPVYIFRKIRSLFGEQKDKKSDFFVPIPTPAELMLKGIMAVERFLMRFVNLPFGVSLFSVFRKG